MEKESIYFAFPLQDGLSEQFQDLMVGGGKWWLAMKHQDILSLSHYIYIYIIIHIYLGKLYRPHCSPSLEIIVSKGNHPQMALIQVSELL